MEEDTSRTDGESSLDSSYVKLYLCHGKYLIWDPSDAVRVRKEYRIIGSYFGCFPPKPRQNVQLSIPLLLSNIEAKFILEHYNVHLFGCVEFANDDTLNAYQCQLQNERQVQYEIQTKLKQEQKLVELDELAADIKKGKTKKMENKICEQSDKKGNVEEVETSMTMPRNKEEATVSDFAEQFDSDDFEKFKKDEIKKVERYGIEQTWIRMPDKSALLSNYQRIHDCNIDLTSDESTKYAVFCDLHNQGYFLTEGVKFGGHFLVYPGDPGIYHSLYIVFCCLLTKPYSLADYSALGRLATSVKKTLLLCSVDKNNEIIYSSIAWSGLV